MKKLTLTCDQNGPLRRAALWDGRNLIGLYLDREDRPDMTGAIIRARAVRVAAGGAKAWFDAGLAAHLYVEGLKDLRSGDSRALRIRTTRGQGKAWSATLCKTHEDDGPLGLLSPPPAPWARALDDWADRAKIEVHCHDRALHALLAADPLAAPFMQPLCKQPVHPDLDDTIEALRAPRITLSGDGEIVIEQTEALVSIDVNGGMGSNPTAINLTAIREIARQIRLRNLSGIIVIDLLKMPSRADGAKIMNAMTRAVADDPAGVRLFGLSKLGLLELTRPRRGPDLAEAIGEARGTSDA